jgi:hypothetical protein
VSVGERFRQVFANCGEDIEKIIKQSNLLAQDLHDVIQYVVPCFPEWYNIGVFYVDEYHHRLRAMFSEFAQQADDLSTQEILVLVEWVHLKYEPQMRALGTTQAVSDTLMDALAPLMQSYKTDIASMMDEWCTRMLEGDRKNEPDEIDGLYYTDAPILLFKSVNQQIDVVQHTRCSKFIGAVFEECLKALNRFQQSILKMLHEEAGELYLEYILALINNNNKCYDYTQELGSKMAKLLDPQLMASFKLQECAESFLHIAEAAIRTVIDIIFADLEPALTKIFQREWLGLC